jgi:hypothetical protein
VYEGSIFSTSSQEFVVFLMIAILTVVKWNLSVVVVTISFMAKNAEDFSHIYKPLTFLPKSVFQIHLPFVNWMF